MTFRGCLGTMSVEPGSKRIRESSMVRTLKASIIELKHALKLSFCLGALVAMTDRALRTV